MREGKTRLSAAWESFRDTSLLAALGVFVGYCLQVRAWIIFERPLQVPNGRAVLLLLAVFALTWLATFIALVRGGTTISDILRGRADLDAHLPTTFVVACLTAFVGFVAEVLGGLWL